MKTAQEWIEQLLLKPVPTWDGPKVSIEDVEAIQRDANPSRPGEVTHLFNPSTGENESVSDQIKRGVISRRPDGSVCEP